MGYKYTLRQWIIEDSSTGRVEKVRAKSRRSLEKRLSERMTIMGTVKSLTKSRRSREGLEKRLNDSNRWKLSRSKEVARVMHKMFESLQNDAEMEPDT